MDLDLLDLQVRTGITQMQKDCEEEETTVQQQVHRIMRTYEFYIIFNTIFVSCSCSYLNKLI
jgi:hypothetical protein